jgi:hypothetical protein
MGAETRYTCIGGEMKFWLPLFFILFLLAAAMVCGMLVGLSYALAEPAAATISINRAAPITLTSFRFDPNVTVNGVAYGSAAVDWVYPASSILTDKIFASKFE